jgi:hypothetical protein
MSKHPPALPGGDIAVPFPSGSTSAVLSSWPHTKEQCGTHSPTISPFGCRDQWASTGVSFKRGNNTLAQLSIVSSGHLSCLTGPSDSSGPSNHERKKERNLTQQLVILLLHTQGTDMRSRAWTAHLHGIRSLRSVDPATSAVALLGLAVVTASPFNSAS